VITWIASQRICVNAPAFNNSTAMAVAPDGRNVVVGGYRVAQLAVFRPTPGGGLALASCVRRAASPSCTWPAARASPRRIASAASTRSPSTPDGRDLLAAGETGFDFLIAG
jgi:hypothetical protein